MLVHAAAGGTGLLLVQLLKRAGAWVVGTCSTEEKAALARDAGCDHVILYRDVDFSEEVERRWNVAGLKERVLESQRRRRFVAPVLRDQGSSWDYQPPAAAGSSYIRNSMPIGELERRARFPAV